MDIMMIDFEEEEKQIQAMGFDFLLPSGLFGRPEIMYLP